MYVDGFVIFVLYALASTALLLAIYNRIEFKDLVKKLNRASKVKRTPPPEVKQRPKGPWNF